MELEDVIAVVKQVHALTGKRVGTSVLTKNGRSDVAIWIRRHYSSFKEFAAQNDIIDICRYPTTWNDESAMRTLFELYKSKGQMLKVSDICHVDKSLFNYMLRRSHTVSIVGFLQEHNIDFVKVMHADWQPSPRKQYQSASYQRKWTREYIIHRLNLMYAIGCRLDAWYLRQHGYGSLLSNCVGAFGTYELACTSAGFDYKRDIIRNKITRLGYGDEFENIVRDIFDIIMPELAYHLLIGLFGLTC